MTCRMADHCGRDATLRLRMSKPRNQGSWNQGSWNQGSRFRHRPCHLRRPALHGRNRDWPNSGFVVARKKASDAASISHLAFASARLAAIPPTIRERDKRPGFAIFLGGLVVRGLALIFGRFRSIGTIRRICFNRSRSVSPASNRNFEHRVGTSQEETASQVFHHGFSSFCY